MHPRRLIPLFFLFPLLMAAAPLLAAEDMITEEEVISLVDRAAEAITADAPAALKAISSGQPPYRDSVKQELYVFVYDRDVNIIAHYNNTLIGRNYRGKPDVRGKKFRDEIVEKALAEGTGWVDYAYTKPGETGIHQKTTYFRRVVGSDGASYVVCAGKYK